MRGVDLRRYVWQHRTASESNQLRPERAGGGNIQRSKDRNGYRRAERNQIPVKKRKRRREEEEGFGGLGKVYFGGNKKAKCGMTL